MSLAAHGWELRPARSLPADPWDAVTALLGARPIMVERQPIRPIAGARSFASGSGFTPLHTDSQDFLGVPPALQVMHCVCPARDGGETLLLDAWALQDDVAKHDGVLHAALFSEPRVIPFYFGAVTGPTVARKGGAAVFTHSPMPPGDPIGRALAPYLSRAHVETIAIRRGEVLLVDNHRMLHGRRAFTDPARELLRLLAWTAPLSAPNFAAPLREVSAPAYAAPSAHQRAVVRELTSGTAPAKLATREGISEAELYRWRSSVYQSQPLSEPVPAERP